MTPTDARIVGGSLVVTNAVQQANQQQTYSSRSAPTQTHPLPLAHQATLSSIDKYYGQQQQAAQPLATNATINGNSNNKFQLANEIDEKLRRFNIHQLRTLAKHKSISTSINKDPMIEKIKSIYRFKSVDEIQDTLNSLNATQRPYQYAMIDPETNPLMVELRKMNNKIEAIIERMDAIEKSQKDIRDALGLICNQTHITRQLTSNSNQIVQRGRNPDYHS